MTNGIVVFLNLSEWNEIICAGVHVINTLVVIAS